jgi:hypothetical protein
MKDKHSDDQISKPQAGVVKVHGEKKYEDRDDTASVPNSGGYEHPEKQVGHEKNTMPAPNAGPHPTGKDKANVATPSAGVHDEHKKKIAFDDSHKEGKRERL